MKRERVRTVVVCLFATLVATGPAFGIFGVGDVVFDPSNLAKTIEQLAEMERQYVQLVQTYQAVQSQYEHLRWMATGVPVDMTRRYRALATPWRTSSASNTYGTTGGWIGGMNTGTGVTAGYEAATQRLGSYGAALDQIPADQQERVKTAYATVELTDGANRHSIETVGNLRANSVNVESAIQGLEEDSLSSDPAMNTEIAVLNKINAAGVIAIRSTQDTNKLLVALAEQQTIDAKRTRDAEAHAINSHIRFVNEGKSVMASQAANASSAMRAWRMP